LCFQINVDVFDVWLASLYLLSVTLWVISTCLVIHGLTVVQQWWDFTDLESLRISYVKESEILHWKPG